MQLTANVAADLGVIQFPKSTLMGHVMQLDYHL